ncbi:hypothetical protein [Mangrovibrevibacter kandeliae]|uniref:hypothetical protein n=1 Tax=Mangrovibrevibacter kandeliae TaxID=2968473 RepID=UPI00211741B1|nr:hypothetical protein [Aurantimonas sp. CSK15Z-1]MCQ8781677.1 hypothetical protein [Aurantimonas sp. CSK15Z-1]
MIDDIFTPAWHRFIVHCASEEAIIRLYEEKTGRIMLRPNGSFFFDSEHTDAENESMIDFICWVTVTHWGQIRGVPEEILAVASRRYPDHIAFADAAATTQLRVVK